MIRRRLLAAAAAPFLGSVSVFADAAKGAERKVAARNRPGDAGWPGSADWAALASSVGGRLSHPRSMLAACETAPKANDCSSLFKALQNPFFIQDKAGGTQVSGYLDAWKPEVSAYVVAAASARDVAAAVNFARRHNLRLVVKGGGHSYLGGSNAPDSLLIWTHAMRDVTVHGAFVPEGCAGKIAPTPAVSLGAGCRWIEAYDAVTTRAGRYVQGGGCASVGVAGLVQGGGFGSFSKRYGTAAASLLEAEIVTADGAIREVNARRHPDLFWALKGGGGGSFGVVTRLTLATHEAPATGGSFSVTIKADSDASFRRLVGAFVDIYAENLNTPHWGEQVAVTPGNTVKVSMVTMDLDDAAVMAAWKPLLDGVVASGGAWRYASLPDVSSTAFRGWWDVAVRRARGSKSMRYDDRPSAPPIQAWWSNDSEQVGAFLHGYDSVWLPADLLKPEARGGLADALFAASRHIDVQLHFNKGIAGAPPEAVRRSRDTSTNPKVADAFVLAIVATGGPPSWYALRGFPADTAHARKDAAAIRAAAAELRRVAPDAGSYVSEADFFNTNWRRDFWGTHYPRLRGVKAKYDPGGMFFVHHGVGSEDWSADGFTRAVEA